MSLAKLAQTGAPLNALTSFSRRIQPADLTDAALFQSFTLGAPTPPPESEPYTGVLGLGFSGISLPTDFSGGGSAVVTVEIGTTADLDQFMTATNIFTAAGTAIENAVNATTPAGGTGFLVIPNDADNPFQFIVTIRSDVNVSLLTAGDVTLHSVVIEFIP